MTSDRLNASWAAFADQVVVTTVLLTPLWYRVVSQRLVVGGLLTLFAVFLGVVIETFLRRSHSGSRISPWLVGSLVPVTVASAALRPSFGLLCGVFLLVRFALMAPTSIGPTGRVMAAVGYAVVAVVVLSGQRIALPAGVLLLALLVGIIFTRGRVVDIGSLDERFVAARRRVGVFGRSWGRNQSWWEGPGRMVLVVALMGVLMVGVMIALRDLRLVLYDDAAIMFRFAERLANGDGFTFNVGDRTNGASAPMYTLLLAALRRGGADLETSAKAIGVACYACALAGVGWLAGRARGPLAGGLAVVLLTLSDDFRTQALSGMESGLAVVLGLGAVLLWSYRHDLTAGFVLGLVVFNKLDGVALVVALTLAALLVDRKMPVRMLAVAGATLMPWLLFSQIYFGSVLPFSFSQKVGGIVGDPNSVHSPWWMLQGFARTGDLFSVSLGAFATLRISAIAWNRRVERKQGAVIACGLWGVAHVLAYSALDLGDPFPWYATVVFAALAVPAGACAGLVFTRAFLRTSTKGPALGLHGQGALILFAIMALVLVTNGTRLMYTLKAGHQIDEYEAFEATRRDAGQYLSGVAAAGEVVETCFGWPSYGALQSPIDEVCPLSTRVAVDDPTWTVVTSRPGIGDLVVPSGFEFEAEFVSDVGTGGGTLVARSVASEGSAGASAVGPSGG